jgi:guanylate kinase
VDLASLMVSRVSRRFLTLGSGLVGGVLAAGHGPSSLQAQSAVPKSSLLSLDQRVSTLEELQRKRPVVVCGPSGVGKGTLLNRLLAEYPDECGFSVSHTTRPPRSGEQDGVHYHFCSIDEMEAMIARNEFIEYARVHGKIYGTSIAAVRDVSGSGKTCLLDIDVQGAESVKKTDLNARFIFISPPSFEELEKRLRGRGTEDEASIRVRLEAARGEMAYRDKEGFFVSSDSPQPLTSFFP